MDADHNPAAAWCVRGVRLPDGDTVEEWWIADGVWRAEPVAGASDLPGGWFLPDGLVDAHAHLTMNQSGHRLPGGSDALIAANLAWPVAPPRPRRAPAHRPGRSHHAATPT